MLAFAALAEVALAEGSPFSLTQTLTNTTVLKLPINCVIAGDQPEEGGGLSDFVRRLIFRE